MKYVYEHVCACVHEHTYVYTCPVGFCVLFAAHVLLTEDAQNILSPPSARFTTLGSLLFHR